MAVNSVNDLLEKPFKSFTREEQLEIIRRGRFTDLDDLSLSEKGKRRTFLVAWYQKLKWLTGDTVTRKLYCWNCVLFPTGANKTWSSLGYSDLRNLSQASRKHEETREHMYSSVKVKLLSRKTEKKIEAADDLGKNLEVKRNREYLERLIDIAGVLAKVGMPFGRGDDENSPYRGMVHLFKKYDDIVRAQLEQGHYFHGMSPTIQISLVQSVEQTVLQKITEEVSASSFFSLIVDEMNSDTEFKRISLSIRYIKNGVPIERFTGLFEVSHGTKSEEVVAIIDKQLERFNYKEKMVSQSYDAKVVKPTELYSLQQAVKSRQQMHCQAQLVHYYGHDLRVLLIQSLNSIQECKLFFSALTLFCNFFRSINFQGERRLFESVPSCITTLRTQYERIMRLLEYVTTDEQYENTHNLIADAVNLITHLKNLKFMIFVTMFHQFFIHVQDFTNRIKTETLDAKSCRDEVNVLIDSLRKYSDKSEFNSLVQSVTECFAGPYTAVSVFTLNKQVVDSLIHEIEGRFLDIELGDFFALVNIHNIRQDTPMKNQETAPLFLSIRENYPNFFNIARLKTELELLYSDPSIAGFGDCSIKHTQDILKFMHDSDLKGHMPVLYKLLELVVTLPSFTEPLEGKLCVFNRLDSYRSLDKKDEPRSGLALLAIERDLLLEMEKSGQWYAQVIDNFAKLPATSSIELVYKQPNEEQGTVEVKMEVISEPEMEIKTEPDMF